MNVTTKRYQVTTIDGPARRKHAVEIQHAGGYTWVWLGANGSVVGRYLIKPTLVA